MSLEREMRDQHGVMRMNKRGKGGCESIQADVVIVIAGGSYVE